MFGCRVVAQCTAPGTGLPFNKPRYVMGIGYPLDIVICSGARSALHSARDVTAEIEGRALHCLPSSQTVAHDACGALCVCCASAVLL